MGIDKILTIPIPSQKSVIVIKTWVISSICPDLSIYDEESLCVKVIFFFYEVIPASSQKIFCHFDTQFDTFPNFSKWFWIYAMQYDKCSNVTKI